MKIRRDDEYNAVNAPNHEFEYQLFYLAKVLVIQMRYTDFYDYLLYNPSGWKNYEKGILAPENDKKRDEILAMDPELADFSKDRRLKFFMHRTSGEGFPPAPSPPSLMRILRFTGLVETSGETRKATEQAAQYKMHEKTEMNEMDRKFREE